MVSADVSNRREQAVGALARGGAWNLLGSLVNGSLALLVTLVLTNGLGAARAGELIQAIGLLTIGVAIAALGSDAGLVRGIAGARAAGRLEQLAPIVRVALAPVVLVGLILGVLVAGLADPLAAAMGASSEGRLATALRVAAPVIPVAAAATAVLGATRGFGDMRPTVIVDRLTRPLLQLAAVGVAVALDAATPWVLVAWAAPFAVSLPAAARSLARRMPTVVRTVPVSEVAGPYWSFAGPHALTTGLQAAVRQVDVLLVGGLMGAREAAIYAAASRLLLAGTFLNQSIVQAAAPNLGEALAVDDREGARELFATGAAWLTVAIWPLFLVLAGWGPLVLGAFGPGFDEGAVALAILASAMLVATAVGPVETVLLMAGRSRLTLADNVAALSANIGLNLVLIPRWGLVGAAVAWAASLACTNLLPLWQVHRAVGIHPLSRAQLSVAAASLTLFVVPAVLARWAGQASVLVMLAHLAIGGALYLAVLARWRRRLGLDRLVRSLGRRARS